MGPWQEERVLGNNMRIKGDVERREREELRKLHINQQVDELREMLRERERSGLGLKRHD